MKSVEHGDEVLVRDVVHNTVATAGNPASSGFQDVHMFFHIALHIRWGALDQRPSDVNVSK